MNDDIEIVPESYENFALRRVRAHFRDNPQVRDAFVENGVMTTIESLCQLVAVETAHYAINETMDKMSTVVDLATDPRLDDEGRATAAALVRRTAQEMRLGSDSGDIA